MGAPHSLCLPSGSLSLELQSLVGEDTDTRALLNRQVLGGDEKALQSSFHPWQPLLFSDHSWDSQGGPKIVRRDLVSQTAGKGLTVSE